MAFRLREGLHFCIAGERVVLLDPEVGSYRALANDQTPAFRRWAMGHPLVGVDRARLLELKGRNVLVGSEADAPPRAMTSAQISPADSALDVGCGKVLESAVARAMAAQLVWGWRAKYWPLKRLLAALANFSPSANQMPSRPTTMQRDAIVRAFSTADMVLGSHNRCLVRSLALTACCRKRGLASTLVIGIQPNPFAAHCWVQDEGLVLNDKPDRVQMFAPILTV